jgi:adenylate cyclase
MKFRTKVLLLTAGVALLTSGASVALVYSQSRQLVMREIQSKVLSIAATTAALTDGDQHEQIQTQADEQTAAYMRLREQLQRARDANRRDDVHVRYLYTMRASKRDPRLVEFGVDSEESVENFSHVGDVFKGDKADDLKLDVPDVDGEFSTDQWGQWLTATAPIRSSTGSPVAIVGVDIASTEVVQKLNRVLWSSLFGFIGALVLGAGAGVWISRRVSRPLETLRGSLQEIGKGKLDTTVPIAEGDEFGEVARSVEAMAVGLQERERLRSGFARYVSQQVVQSIVESGETPVLSGQRKHVTVLFADIRGFTSMSERLPPEKVVKLLNEYFERMIDVVFRHGGTLDKFMGDGLMVLFGAPLDDPYQEEHAVRAALDMQRQLRKLCEKWKLEGRGEVRIGIGINSGNAIVGNVGSMKRMEYTAIGDTVNLASRLETATKELGVEILMSEYTYSATRAICEAERMGEITVKGRTEPVTVFSPKGMLDETSTSRVRPVA